VNLQKIQAGVDRIRLALQARNDGWANEEARKEIFEAYNLIEWSCDQGNHIIEKVGDIRIAADHLFSARKHLKFKRGSDNGILVLRARIESALHQVETWPHVLEDRMKSSPQTDFSAKR
jgi:hypothetical protein